MASDPLHPTVLWAQRSDCIYLTICLGDVKSKTLNLKEDCLEFKGKAGTPELKEYAVKVEFHDKVNTEESKQMSTDRQIVMYIKKKTDGFWPQLLKCKGKPNWLKTDFERWVDEDESGDEMGTPGMGGMGGGGAGGMDFANMMSQMSSFGGLEDGMGGMDGMDADVDSDDEDLPDLDPAAAGDADVSEEPKTNGKSE